MEKGHGPLSSVMERLSQNDSPQVAEAFSKSNLIPLSSNPRHPSNQSPFPKGQIA
jgi:hypothetical protein